MRTLLRHALLPAMLMLAFQAQAATFTVTTTADAGPGSLREAIQSANNAQGLDLINFNLPGIGERVISLATPLPSVSGPTYFDGHSQPGFTTAPLIRIDGNALAGSQTGLYLNGGGITVRGLKFTRCNVGIAVFGNGAEIYGVYLGTDGTVPLGNDLGMRVFGDDLRLGGTLATSRNVISGNHTGVYLDPGADGALIVNSYIGTNTIGSAAMPNTYAGIRSFGNDLVVGGNTAAERNLISGNARYGVSLDGGSFAIVTGNYIGTNAAGTAAIGNDTGIDVHAGNGHTVGGVLAGTGNLVSGNVDTGVYVGSGASLLRIRGNRIGSNEAGTSAIGNGQYGVYVNGTDVDVGALGASGINVISGNGRDGVGMGLQAQGVHVFNNRIGTDLAGNAALPNEGVGVYASGTDIEIGPVPNVISGNGDSGIAASNVAGLRIRANRIGTNLAGTAAIGNGDYGIRLISGSGVVIGAPGFGNQVSGNPRAMSIENANGAVLQANNIGLDASETAVLANDGEVDIGSDDNLIGGTGAGEGNVIAGTDGGLRLGDGAARNRVEGNFLGSNRARTFVPGNGYASLFIYDGFDNVIGGTQPGAGNVIAGNYAAGIFTRVGKRNAFLGNSIHDNELSGIDSEPVGPSPNDAFDLDQGPNENQNRPVLRSAMAGNNLLTILGELRSAAQASYRVEFFHNPTCHASGLGEGRTYLGFQDVSTDASGVAVLATSLSSNANNGFVSATATSADGNTSEFSPCIAVGVPGNGKFSFWRDPGLSYEDRATVDIHVVRSEGLEGTVTVNFSTMDSTATAPSDYATVQQVLTFAPGEWLRVVTVPLVLDNDVEGDEDFIVTLSNPTGGATVATAQANYLLFDHEAAFPFLMVSNVVVSEPLNGQALASFNVTLSGTDHAVKVDYETVAETATAGIDFTAKTGTLAFPASPNAQTLVVSVPVLADAMAEDDETFRLDVTGNSGSFIASDTVGEAVIKDGTFNPSRVFANGFE